MRKLIVYIIGFVAAVIAVSMATETKAAKPSAWDTEARIRKADYYFLEAQNASGCDNVGDYILLTERAFALDSTDIDIAGEWGLVALMVQADSASVERGYNYMKRRFLANPADYTTAAMFASVARTLKNIPDMVRTWEILDSIYPTRAEATEMLARSYLISYLTGDTTAFDKVIAIYDRMEAGMGKNTTIASQKIYTYMVHGDTLRVDSELQELLEASPYDSEVAVFAGQTYESLGRRDRALELYNRACELDSTNGEAYYLRAQFYRQKGDSVAFDREVFHALTSANLDVDTKVEMLHGYVADLYTDPAQEPRIRQLFEQLQRVNPGESQIHSLYGAYLFEIQDYAGSAEQMSFAAALDPDNEQLWTAWVQSLSYSMNDKEIEEVTPQAMTRFPHNAYFPVALTNTLAHDGQLDRAIEIADSVDVNNFNDLDAASRMIAFRGDLYAQKGDTIKALELYDDAIYLNPDNYLALNNAAYFMAVNGGDLDKAEQYSARAVKANPENATYLDTYAWIFFLKGDYMLARQYIDMTMHLFNSPEESDEDDTPSHEIYEHAGDIYFWNKEPKQALEYWKKALELDPDNELLKRKVKDKTYHFE